MAVQAPGNDRGPSWGRTIRSMCSAKQVSDDKKFDERTLHVRGVGGELENESKLAATFERFGEVKSCKVRSRRNSQTGENTSWALVTFAEAQAMMEALKSTVVTPENQILQISKYCPEKASSSTGLLRKIDEAARETVRRQEAAEAASTFDGDAEIAATFVKHDGKCPVFDPRSPFLPRVDMCVALLVLISAIHVPFLFAFEDELAESFPTNFWLIFDLSVDSFFLCRMVIEFRTALLLPNGSRETKQSKIACHYLRGWFLLDFVASFPFEIVIALLRGSDEKAGVLGAVRGARLIRIGRLLRLLRLIRIVKLVRLQMQKAVTMRIGELLIITFIYSHWLGCAWYYVSKVNGFAGTGFGYSPFSRADDCVSIDQPGEYVDESSDGQIQDTFPGMIAYWTSLNWGMTILKSWNTHSPPSLGNEVALSLVASSSSMFLLVFITSKIIILVSTHTSYRMKVNKWMADCESTVGFNELDDETKNKIRLYVHEQSATAETLESSASLMQMLPPGLRKDVECRRNEPALRQLSWLRSAFEQVDQLDEEVAIIRAVSSACTRAHIHTSDVLCEEGDYGDYIAFILDGAVDIEIRKKRSEQNPRGKVAQKEAPASVGELCFLDDEYPYRTATMRAVRPCEILKLYRSDFDDICNKFVAVREAFEADAAKEYQRLVAQGTLDKGYILSPGSTSPSHGGTIDGLRRSLEVEGLAHCLLESSPRPGRTKLLHSEREQLLSWLLRQEQGTFVGMDNVVDHLLDCIGIDVLDAPKSQDGNRSGLLSALRMKRYGLAHAMLRFGADPTHRDCNNKDCLDYATHISNVTERRRLSVACRVAKSEFGLFCMPSQGGREIFYQFEDDLLIHTSETSNVVRVTETDGLRRKRVMKFMRDKTQYDTEIKMREFTNAENSQQAAVQLIHNCIVKPEELTRQAIRCRRLTPKATVIKNFGCHVVVMERCERTLAEVIDSDMIAGLDVYEVISAGRKLARCLLCLETDERIHGDLKPRNVMEYHQELSSTFSMVDEWLADLQALQLLKQFESRGVYRMDQVQSMSRHDVQRILEAAHSEPIGLTKDSDVAQLTRDLETKNRLLIKLIDLDSGAKYGDIAGTKWSSAYAPPELAVLIYRYKYSEATAEHYPISWSEYLTNLAEEEQVVASVAFDVWGFGMVMFGLSAPDGAMPFVVSSTDNIVRKEELSRLAHEWDMHKLSEISKLVWPAAQDLVLWCLQTKPSRRPASFREILEHRFFGGSAEMRFLKDEEDTLYAAAARSAINLHRAIEMDEIEDGLKSVRELIDRGCVHFNLCLQGDHLTTAQKSVSPIHRAARYGRVEVLQTLLDEIHPQVRADVLNTPTEYNYSALHWSCVYGHPEVARQLIDSGCSISLVTHRGRTAWDLAEHLFLIDPAVTEHMQPVKKLLKLFDSNQYGSMDAIDAELASTIGTTCSATTWKVLKVFIELASSPQHADESRYEELRLERRKRARRPEERHFFDDIEIDPARLDFWSVEPYDQWDSLAEEAYAQIGTQADPAIELHGRRFHRLALKLPEADGVEELQSEVESLHHLSHPNVIQILGVVHSTTISSKEEKVWAMALEWCDSSLSQLLNEPELVHPPVTVDLELVSHLCHQIVDGMAYVHSQTAVLKSLNGEMTSVTIMHLDLKPENIQLAVDSSMGWVAKVGGFGWRPNQEPESWKCTAEYMAPEWQHPNLPVAQPADVFSFGVILWQMVSRAQTQVWKHDWKHGWELGPTAIPDGFPTSLRLLVEACWTVDPHRRLTFLDLQRALARKAVGWFATTARDWVADMEFLSEAQVETVVDCIGENGTPLDLFEMSRCEMNSGQVAASESTATDEKCQASNDVGPSQIHQKMIGSMGLSDNVARKFNRNVQSIPADMISLLRLCKETKVIVMSCPEKGTLKPDDSQGPYEELVMDKVNELRQRGRLHAGFDRAGSSNADSRDTDTWPKVFHTPGKEDLYETHDQARKELIKSTYWFLGYRTAAKAQITLECQGFDGSLEVICIRGGSITEVEHEEMEQIIRDAKRDAAQNGIQTADIQLRKVSYHDFLREYDPESLSLETKAQSDPIDEVLVPPAYGEP